MENTMSIAAKANRRQELKDLQRVPLSTPTDLTPEATRDVTGAMNALLADVFALYLKTKNFHWHLSGPHFRDYHLLFDDQGDQIFAMTDPIAERVRKIGGSTIKSIGHIARLQRVLDNDADYVDPEDMLAELCEDNKTLTARLREAQNFSNPCCMSRTEASNCPNGADKLFAASLNPASAARESESKPNEDGTLDPPVPSCT
jgi:starvation-inducible DNA-binding protein